MNRVWSTIAAMLVTMAAGQSVSQELSATEIMNKMDDVLYPAKDKEFKMRFVLVDKSGKESVRELAIIEKGPDRRLMQFTSPADQKGIGFLSLPNNIMYVYLPAFGKARRIASHVKNTKFAGSDLTYENMEAKRYSEQWDPQLSGKDTQYYTLLLTPKKGVQSESSKIVVKVRIDNFYPVRIEYHDKAGKYYKLLTRSKIERTGGKYWEAKESVMEDLKTAHTTKWEIIDVKYDSGVADDKFTERYLMR
jgi:outer membrane lipoprotein-sorting protein